MQTTNLVSTPNITGNIGSCASQVVDVETWSGFSKDIGYHVTTNSCTGQVTNTQYENFGGGITCLILIVTFFIGVIVSVMLRD